LTRAIQADIEQLPLDPASKASFTTRLQANMDAKLGLHICQPKTHRTPQTRRQRWSKAIAFAKSISADSPKWRAPATIAAVAAIAYLAPAHSRAATTPSECLSLGFNLMALGGVFAMAATPPLPPVDPNINPGTIAAAAKGAKAGKGGSGGGCCGGGCGDCDCCCDAECCLCEALSCDACGSCGSCCECGDCCSGCGDCCSGCDC
jgi:hypothetical protein